ncbi:VOC family protein [Alicyclobacillus fastidiosus]|uniref:VOC family protein n=1 Tax=Alicyclobacillus fastidiosus TaxID=392011 RepID=A0ABY6ZKF4_9BACL|nr:VOC family protein [Alicyclobacillus fastidiosus]WAH43403.1 VOC family protein [Alicyclobacillus fastidiosus]GMA65475.1 hypothetical protein GCM10025859_59150 [Alicyclobacillus fastidiosus]
MHFHATRLLVSNFRESLEFYRDVLDFKGWHNDEMEYAYFEKQQLALFARERMPAALARVATPPSSQFVLQFEVDDVDEVSSNF